MVIAAWSQCHRRDWSKFGHWTNLYNDKDGDMNYFLQKILDQEIKKILTNQSNFAIVCFS